MEENIMLKCIRKSQEYGVLILDSFQHEPIYIFPRNFTGTFKPPHKISSQEIINYRDIKCGVDIINPSYILVIIIPSIPDHIIKQTLSDTLQVVQPIFSEMSINQEEFLTPKSTERSAKHKKVLKPDLFEKLSELLEIFLSVSIYKIYPYFRYEDEEFENSPLSFPCVCLPIAIGASGLYFNLSIPLMMQLDMNLHILFHESTVTVHEVLSLEKPSGIIKDVLLMYKGYIISGSFPKNELTELMRIVNAKRLYMRNETFPQESFVERIKKGQEEVVISIVCTQGFIVAITIIPLTDGSNDYDPWFVDKAKRFCNELNEAKFILKIEEEFKQILYLTEIDAVEDPKKQELLSIMKKSRSLDSSPIGSPRGQGLKDKIYKPVYYPQHDLYVFHYALVDTITGLANTPHVIASSRWFMDVLRPLFSHYAQLYENISKCASEFIEVNAKFSDIFDCENVVVLRIRNFYLYAMYRGSIENLKQFAYEIISSN